VVELSALCASRAARPRSSLAAAVGLALVGVALVELAAAVGVTLVELAAVGPAR